MTTMSGYETNPTIKLIVVVAIVASLISTMFLYRSFSKPVERNTITECYKVYYNNNNWANHCFTYRK